MTDGFTIILAEDGTFKEYDDEYDVTIHCESQVEQDEVLAKLNATSAPEPKIGYWEWTQYDGNPKLGNWHCSKCRSIVVECIDKNDKSGIPLYKYCPQCGAKMQEVEE